MLTVTQRLQKAVERARQTRSNRDRAQLQTVQKTIDELEARGALKRQEYSLPLPTETERQYHTMVTPRRFA